MIVKVEFCYAIDHTDTEQSILYPRYIYHLIIHEYCLAVTTMK